MVSDLSSNTDYILPIKGNWQALDQHAVEQAYSLSQTITEVTARWSAYLALLALEGFDEWFQQHTIPIRLEREKARLIEPTGFDAPAGITQVMLNQLRICLIPVGSTPNDEIEIPHTVLTQQSNLSHFYVTVAVEPENQMTQVQGFFRGDQLQSLIPTLDSSNVTEHCFYLPTAQLETDLEHLLLFASNLEPAAIPLASVQTALGVSSKLRQRLIQPVVRADEWLKQKAAQALSEFDQAIEYLGWVVAPPLDPIRIALRETESFHPLSRLRGDAMSIPDSAVAAHQDIRVGNRAIRLSAIMWALPDEQPASEWSLLALIEPLSDDIADGDIRLVLSDQEKVLVERSLTLDSDYEAAQAIGEMHEQLRIKLIFASGDELSLPPFKFT